MGQYTYVAITPQGKEKKGNIEAADEAKAKMLLKRDGLLPISIIPAGALTRDINISFGALVKPRELAVFCRQFQSILNAGVTIIDALKMLAEQTENKAFKKALIETVTAVGQGETLGDAMRQNPKIFPDILINLVDAGEASGSMDKVFARMATHFEKSARTKALVKKAMVAATVKEIDFTQIQAQFDAYFTAYKKNISDQYQDYIAAIQSFKDQAQEQYDLMVQAFNTYAEQQKELYEDWIAEQESGFEEWSSGQQSAFAQWRQNQEQAFNNWYLNNTGKWTNDFLKWFDGIKGILGTDPAGALQNEIETLQNIIYSGEVPAALVTTDGDELVTADGDQLIAFWTLKTSETCHC